MVVLFSRNRIFSATDVYGTRRQVAIKHKHGLHTGLMYSYVPNNLWFPSSFPPISRKQEGWSNS